MKKKQLLHIGQYSCFFFPHGGICCENDIKIRFARKQRRDKGVHQDYGKQGDEILLKSGQ